MWNDAATRVKPADSPETVSQQEERRVSAWVGKSLRIEGKIISRESLTINGEVVGTIEVGDHNLTIGSGAAVTADLTAKTITVSGSVTGNLLAHDLVELHPTASIEGDITTPRLRMAEGAVITGRVEVNAQRATGVRTS